MRVTASSLLRASRGPWRADVAVDRRETRRTLLSPSSVMVWPVDQQASSHMIPSAAQICSASLGLSRPTSMSRSSAGYVYEQ